MVLFDRRYVSKFEYDRDHKENCVSIRDLAKNASLALALISQLEARIRRLEKLQHLDEYEKGGDESTEINERLKAAADSASKRLADRSEEGEG